MMKNREDGFILITVVLIVLLISVLVAGIVTTSQLTIKSVAVNNNLSASAYKTEGVANRINYITRLKIADSLNINGIESKTGLIQRSRDKLNAVICGKEREIIVNGETYLYSITDAAGGLDFSGFRPVKAIGLMQTIFVNDSKKQHLLTELLDKVIDYNDTDDFVSLHGSESAQYYSKKLNLPRNNQMNYRSELLFIPMARKFISADKDGRLNSLKMIVPKGLNNLNSKRFLLNASLDDLRYNIKDYKNKADNILSKLEEIKSQKYINIDNVANNFEFEYGDKIKQKFALNPSGVYTIKVTKKIKNKLSFPSKSFYMTESLNKNNTAFEDQKRQFYEVLVY